ncbi:MAG: hypothetical protein ACYCQI_02350 [Gammaproteobacteria bacterium]
MQKNCLIIAIMIVLTGAVAISTHVLILQYFQPPAITISLYLNQMIGFIIRFAVVIGAMLIYFLSKEHWGNIRPFYRIILFAILIMALTEQLFRSPIMEIVAGTPWAYEILETVPSYVGWLILSLLICLFIPIISKQKKLIGLKYFVFSILATALVFFAKKIANDLISPLLTLVPQIDMSKLTHPPYGINIIVPAYITFLEPTVASFIVFYLIKDKLLRFDTLIKGLIMGGILVIIHGGIYSIVQIVNSEGSNLYRLFYYGQFLWEYLALGILTAYSFAFLEKKLHKSS